MINSLCLAIWWLTRSYFFHFLLLFVAAPHQFGVIVTCFIGYFMVTAGWFSHPVGQILTILSILVCVRTTSTTTNCFCFHLEFSSGNLPDVNPGPCYDAWSINVFHLLGDYSRNLYIPCVHASWCHCLFHPLLLFHPPRCCHLSDRACSRVSCPLGCQSETGIKKGEWIILEESLS